MQQRCLLTSYIFFIIAKILNMIVKIKVDVGTMKGIKLLI